MWDCTQCVGNKSCPVAEERVTEVLYAYIPLIGVLLRGKFYNFRALQKEQLEEILSYTVFRLWYSLMSGHIRSNTDPFNFIYGTLLRALITGYNLYSGKTISLDETNQAIVAKFTHGMTPKQENVHARIFLDDIVKILRKVFEEEVRFSGTIRECCTYVFDHFMAGEPVSTSFLVKKAGSKEKAEFIYNYVIVLCRKTVYSVRDSGMLGTGLYSGPDRLFSYSTEISMDEADGYTV